jgi:hypothetical protein
VAIKKTAGELAQVIDLEAVIKTVCSMDAAIELIGMYEQRVLKIASRSISKCH